MCEAGALRGVFTGMAASFAALLGLSVVQRYRNCFAVLKAEFAVQEIASLKIIGQEKAERVQLAQERVDMGLSRKADAKPGRQRAGTK